MDRRVLLLVLGACAHSAGEDDPALAPGARDDGDASFVDAAPPPASSADSASTVPSDSAAAVDSPADSSHPPTTDAGHEASSPPDAGPLDPGLSLPDPNGAPCTSLGIEVGCPAYQVCRIASPSGGRCEGCASCGHLGDRCSATNECDILFECYKGKCTNFCQLGTYMCGAIADCINVGHPTEGVCKTN
jgi:hypothetical protein